MTGNGNGKGKGKGRIEPRNLPEDAVTEILLRFPVKSLLRFRCVSKVWCAQIDCLKFRKKHHSYLQARSDGDDAFFVVNREYTSFSHNFGCRMNFFGCRMNFLSCYDDYESLSCLNSSSDLDINSFYFSSFSYHINGIVCVIYNGLNVYLCNPALREIRQLPKFPRFPADFGITCPYNFSAVGIGFDDATDDYVVVQFIHDGGDSDSHDLKCVSYHVKAKSLTMIDMPPALVSAYSSTLKKRYGSFDKLHASFFSHGCIHWCMEWRHLILTLNMNNNLFQEIQFPHGWKDYGYTDYAYLLKVDSSSIALVNTRGNGHDLNIWVMKEYGVAESWTKQYCISDYTLRWISKPLSFWRNKLILLTSRGELICYDLFKGQLYEPPRRGQCDPMSLPHTDMRTLEVVSCYGSLVSVYQS